MIWENVVLAISSLKSNKMRSLLTMLGIIIGIMSIIAIVIIGDAMSASVSDSLSILGTSNITVGVRERSFVDPDNPFYVPNPRRVSSSGRRPESVDLLSDRMIEDMRANFPTDVAGVSLSHSGGSAQARNGDDYANISINGANADYTKANNITMVSGTFISEDDVTGWSNSAVVSDRFVKNLFPGEADVIGKQVRIYRPNVVELYTIVGVYLYEEMDFMGSTVSDRDLVTTFHIPISTAKQDAAEKNHVSITVIGAPGVDVNELTARLQNYFDGVYAGNSDWRANVSNLTSMMDAVSEAMGSISMAIAFIASISLLVGGIGVMNIMLVSVTERTREIGVRKALGAKNFHIRFQFVTEALIIAAIGGVIGLILGIVLGASATTLFEVPLVISPLTTAGSVLFSMFIGVFFGLYPANKAAKLDPIDALRYE